MFKTALSAILLLATSFLSPPPVEVAPLQNNYRNIHQAADHKPQLTLYYTSYCPYSQKVLSYLEQIHKSVPMKNVESSRRAKDELRAVGGKLQVPCLVIDGKALYESDAIIQWLSEHKDLLDP